MADEINNLETARKLMLYAEYYAQRRKNPRTKALNAKEVMAQDKVILSSTAAAGKTGSASQEGTVEQTNIRLSELISQLKGLEDQQKKVQSNQAAGKQEIFQFQASETITTKISVEMTSWKPVEGLVVRDQHLAETDRYRFEFKNGTELTILDKWSMKSTRIWGDPHIDLDDVEGDYNGDFSDLKGSDSATTFQLMDGTRLTFTAKDNGIIESVDIFKDNQHVHGIGSGSAQWQNEESGLFDTKVKQDGHLTAAGLEKGDVVVAGGDGGDWFDTTGNLLWGHSGAAAPTSRPLMSVSMNFSQVIHQEISAQLIERQG